MARDRAEIERLIVVEMQRQIDLRNQLNSQDRSLLESIERRITSEQAYEDKLLRINSLREVAKGLTREERKAVDDKIKLLEKQLQVERKIVESRKELIKTVTQFDKTPIFKSLMEGDRAIKQTNLSLGLSNKQVFSLSMGANVLATNFQGSAMYAARLGMSLGDVAKMQMAYSDESSRSISLNVEMLKSLSQIAAGTGMGAQNAGVMNASFERIGMNAMATRDFVEDTVNKAQQMGINSSKVFTTLNNNFNKLQTFTFKNSVNGLRDMVLNSEKFKINIQETMVSAEKARGLEGVIEMASNLQVLGGQFAKLADPMAMLYESRNDLEAYTQRIGDMTKGMVAMRKTTDGFRFELASPASRDMLNQAAKSLGISSDEMIKQAYASKEIFLLRQQMSGMGLTSEQKLLIEAQRRFDTKGGKFTVQIGKDVVEVGNLTKNQIEALKIQKSTLEERALNSQTFDEALKNTISDFKSILLPMLNGINEVLQVIRPVVTNLSDFISKIPGLSTGLAYAGGVLMAAIVAFKTWNFGKSIANTFLPARSIASNIPLPSIGGGGSSAGGGSMGAPGGAVNNPSPYFTRTGMIRKGAPELIRAQGMKNLSTGAGVGAAGLGIGAGVGLAAVGISKLADAMKGMTKEQADALVSITWSLTTMSAVGAAAAAAIGYIGASATVASPGLGMLALSILGIGAGIGLAAAGIGYMVSGLGNLIVSGKGAGSSLLDTALGVTALMGAFALGGGTAVFGGIGLALFASQMATISSFAEPMKVVGDAFGNIATVMRGTKEDFAAVESAIKTISSVDMSKSGVFTDLLNVLKSPIKVEFANKDVAMVANITLNMDGKRLMDNLSLREHITLKTINGSRGTSS